jgi:glycosyltransferase involved in cell wall biosynthesis
VNVSIIIPVYNEEDYLAACLDAVAAQTVKPFEVIVVDNNCTDKTAEIARKYPFVRLITEKQQGTVFARNAGFRAAEGDILGRIDADTRIPKDWVARVVKLFNKEPEIAALTGSARFYDVAFPRAFNALLVPFYGVLYQYFQRLLSGTYILWGANMAIRREVWNHIAPSCSVRRDINEDTDVAFRLHEEGLTVRYWSGLKVVASWQRGHTSFGYTIPYMSAWPRDYALHGMYVRAAVIILLITIIVIICSPLLLFGSVKERFAD